MPGFHTQFSLFISALLLAPYPFLICYLLGNCRFGLILSFPGFWQQHSHVLCSSVSLTAACLKSHFLVFVFPFISFPFPRPYKILRQNVKISISLRQGLTIYTGCPGTHCIDGRGLQITGICLPLSPGCQGERCKPSCPPLSQHIPTHLS